MRNEIVEIAILCGGPGKRMGKFALDKQKCMLEVDGRPILEHLFEQIIKAFVRAKIILLVGYKSNDVYNYFGGRYKGLQLNYAPESIMGTRLALLGAEEFIEGTHFISMDGDAIINGVELIKLINSKRPDSLGTLWVSPRLEIAPTHGLAMMRGRRILKIDYPATQTIFKGQSFRLMDMGFYSKKLLDYLKATNIPTITGTLDSLLREGKIVEGKIYRDNWFHFVKPEDLRAHIQF